MRTLFFTALFLLVQFAMGKEIKYEVSAIDASLLKEATSVVRQDNRIFEIADIGKATYMIEYAVTILSESAYERAIFRQPYDKFTKVKSIKATIYDKSGLETKKIKYEDIRDISLIQDLTSFDDNRVKYFDPEYKFFPFTIEYSYEIQYTGLMSYPDWSPYQQFDESVENSSFTIITGNNFEIKYLVKNGAPEPEISEDTKSKRYTWKMSGLPAVDYPYFSNPNDLMPVVHTAPTTFEIGGSKGTCNTWQDFASWISNLNKEGNNLSADAKTQINEMVKGVTDPHKKIEILYSYMQNKTRYVSIQLGIGGWKPFDANTVERLGYGDCKALTNYMKSILEVAGIPSNYVLVRSGKYDPAILTSFPCNQFNHAFLMVPLSSDTVWLECTSQQVPYNYLGTFTDDRDVLVIENDGGKIVRTPAWDELSNTEYRNIIIDVNTDGSALVSSQGIYKGAKYMDVFGFLHQNEKQVEQALHNRIDIKDFNITSFNYTDQRSEIVEDLNLVVAGYGKKNGNKIVIPLNLMNKVTSIPKKEDDRKIDVFIRRSFSEKDHITVKIPASLHPGSNPEHIQIESEFGSYRVSIEMRAGEIEYVREFTMRKGTYPPSDYNKLIDFLSEVARADRMKVMLVSGT